MPSPRYRCYCQNTAMMMKMMTMPNWWWHWWWWWWWWSGWWWSWSWWWRPCGCPQPSWVAGHQHQQIHLLPYLKPDNDFNVDGEWRWWFYVIVVDDVDDTFTLYISKFFLRSSKSSAMFTPRSTLFFSRK